jgi:hypothetical protein
MYIKPAEGLTIFDPFSKDHIPAEGREVPDGDLYWQRLLMDGDVFVVDTEAETDSQRSTKK